MFFVILFIELLAHALSLIVEHRTFINCFTVDMTFYFSYLIYNYTIDEVAIDDLIETQSRFAFSLNSFLLYEIVCFLIIYTDFSFQKSMTLIILAIMPPKGTYIINYFYTS